MIEGLKPYERYKQTSSRYLGSIPKHWEERLLWTISTVRTERNPGGLPLLSVFLDRGVIPYGQGSGQVHAPSLDQSNYQVVCPGDFVLNNQQAWRGSVGVSRLNGVISPAYIVLRLSKQLNPRYANYLLRCPRMVDQYVAASKGVGDIQRQVFWPFLRRVAVSVPTGDEQAAIVRFIDHANRRIDRYIRAKRKLIALLNEQKQAIIQRAVTRGLDPRVPMKDSGVPFVGQIPKHWPVVMNGVLFRETTRPYQGALETQLSLSQRDGLVAKADLKERSMQTSSFDNWKVVLPGDLVLNRFKAHLGVFFSADIRGIVTFHYGVFRPRVSIETKYFELLYHTFPYRAVFAGRSNGMTVGLQNLSNQNFYGVRSPLPPAEEQLLIVRKVEEAVGPLCMHQTKLAESISLANEYRTRLIADVVTGQLDVREAARGLPDLEPDELEAEPEEADTEDDLDEAEGAAA